MISDARGETYRSGIVVRRCGAGAEVGAADELFHVAPESGGVDGFADGLPQVVLRGGEQVEQRCRVVLRTDELADDGLSILIQDLEVAGEVAGDRRTLARDRQQRRDVVAQGEHRVQPAVDGSQQILAGNDRRAPQAGFGLRQAGVQQLLCPGSGDGIVVHAMPLW
jgi:hypothetical protein